MVWGRHRDTAELTHIAVPVFSYGRCPAGPVRLDEQEPSALASARFGACLVTRDDIVFGDDGVVLVAPRWLSAPGRRGPPSRSATYLIAAWE
jgi:4-hydroxy-4-methyl-2-oxoglutarate aldolase